jgi:hypothetical protein
MKTENKMESTDEQKALVEKGKEIIDSIGMSCDNDFVVIDSLMALLELFSQPVISANAGDLAEDLQQHLFTWTEEHGSSFSQWKGSVLTGKKYGIQGEISN